MKYDDLEKTQDLFDLEDVPTPIDTIEMEGIDKDHLEDMEIQAEKYDNTINPIVFDVPKKEKKVKEKKEKKSLKEKWNELDKKQKIIIILSFLLILIVILILVLVFALKDDKVEEPPVKKPTAPEVIVEKENYIYKDGNLVFIDDEEKEIGTYACKNKDEKLCYVVYYSDEDDFDVEKYVFEDKSVIPRRSKIYQGKYVFVYDNNSEENGMISLYNIEKGEKEGTYTLVKGFSESDFVILKNDKNKYGAIAFNEEGFLEKVSFTFDYLGQMNKDSNLVGFINNKYYLYSMDGKAISRALSYEIKSFNNKYVVASNEGAYQVYDMQGNLIFDEVCEYIKLYNDYVALVQNNLLYIRDYSNFKYNESGIRLGNTEYNPKHIYNENKEKVETKQSFFVTSTKDEITVTYYNKNKEKKVVISLKDINLNKELPFANYLDGKIYFYKDEEKTQLLGSYTCNHKNEDDVTNCFVATESFFSKNSIETDQSEHLGLIPIFNEQYVFVHDAEVTKEDTNPYIALYDLKNKKTLSKYLSVDTGSYTSSDKITFKDVDELFIMAQNRDKEYGLIKLGRNEVKGIITFDKTSIEKLNNYYMVRTTSNTYSLYDKKGVKVTSEYGYKIVDYKNIYLKVTDNQKFYVYDFNGNPIEETKYDYIHLENDYYVVINNNELDIHKYSDSLFKLSKTINVDSASDKAYQVSKTDTSFIVKVNDNTYEFSISTGKDVNEPVVDPDPVDPENPSGGETQD